MWYLIVWVSNSKRPSKGSSNIYSTTAVTRKPSKGDIELEYRLVEKKNTSIFDKVIRRGCAVFVWFGNKDSDNNKRKPRSVG